VKRIPRPLLTDEALRAASQTHYDARRLRLVAYAETLRHALAGEVESHGESSRAIRLGSQIAIVERQLIGASRSRVPRAAPPPIVAA
jgi:hypothetical protein